MTRVVIVGRRQGALAAAAELGLETICVDGKPLLRRHRGLVARFVERPLDAGEAVWQAVALDLVAEGPIAAVFASTESAVLPAAHLREALGIAGDSAETAVLCTDKLVMKRAMTDAGLRCARFVGDDQSSSAAALIAELGLPMVVKPRTGMGGRRHRIYERPEEVQPLSPGWMAESFVDGVEMSVESLVAGGRPAFVNPTEYYRVRWANVVPAHLPAAGLQAVEKLNAAAITAAGIGDAWTHMEVFLTPEGPVFGEIAARPPGGHISELITLAYGFDPWRQWLLLGLGEELEAVPRPQRAAGVWLLHPGRGLVERVEGVEEARALAGVERVECRLKPGETVDERVGSGQESGHVLVSGRDRDEVVERLTAARAAIHFVMAG